MERLIVLSYSLYRLLFRTCHYGDGCGILQETETKAVIMEI